MVAGYAIPLLVIISVSLVKAVQSQHEAPFTEGRPDDGLLPYCWGKCLCLPVAVVYTDLQRLLRPSDNNTITVISMN